MKILLVRADGIGDALACAPLLAALRAARHDVGAVLGTRNRSIFAPSALRAVHVLERIAWPAHGSTAASYASALEAARAERYDVALIASEEPEAYAFARAAGISRRVGFVNGWVKPLKTLALRGSLTRAIVRPASASRVREHEVTTIFRLGEGFVEEPEPTRDLVRLRAIVLGDDRVTQSRAPEGTATIVVAVSTKLAACGLDKGAFVALARALRDGPIAGAIEIAICGENADLVRAVAREGDARSYAGLDVARWKALVARASYVITPDSGAAHVAGMLGVPTVDAFAPGPATAYDARRWAPWAAPYRTVTLDPTRDACGTATMLVDALADLARDRAGARLEAAR